MATPPTRQPLHRAPLSGSSAALAAVAALGLAASLHGCSCDGSATVTMLEARIEVSPPILDLGDVHAGALARGVLTVKSVGESALTIEAERLDVTAELLVRDTLEKQLPPGGSDLVVFEGRFSAPAVIEGVYVIDSDDRGQPTVSVPIRARVLPAPPCDDGNDCTRDTYDPDTDACRHDFADGVPCEPADRCIIQAVCSQGVCLGTPKTCDDSSPCTKDLCRQSDGECQYLTDPGACDDQNPCTSDGCGPAGCFNEPVVSGSACDDGDACTMDDTCFLGECRGQGAPEGEACDDGDSCTVEDTCHEGACAGRSIVTAAQEGQVIFEYPLQQWNGAFLHRREVSMSDDGVFVGLDHLPLTEPIGLTHVAFTVEQCGGSAYEFAYRPPDSYVLVSFVRREMQLTEDGKLRIVVGVRQLQQDGFQPVTTTYVLDTNGDVLESRVRERGGETGRALLPDGSHIYGVIWPTNDATTWDAATQNLQIVREDRTGQVLWRHERESLPWAEFLGVAGPRVLFWSNRRFGALDFNTGQMVWSTPTAFIAKEMALSTSLNLGVARVGTTREDSQLIGVEIIGGREVFLFPPVEDATYLARTDPVISADGRILVLMQKNDAETGAAVGLDWVELTPEGTLLHSTPLGYAFSAGFDATRHEDDPYPTVADDGVSYIGYGDTFWAIEPGGRIRWTLTSTIPHAFTGTVPLLREDGVMLISEAHRKIKGVRTNGGKMSRAGWASFRHDGRRTKFTP